MRSRKRKRRCTEFGFALCAISPKARRGRPLHEVIRSYQLSSARWYQICAETLATLTTDVGVVVSETAALSALTSDYLDRMCERAIEQSLGRAIDADPVNIGLALQANRWLGSSSMR